MTTKAAIGRCILFLKYILFISLTHVPAVFVLFNSGGSSLSLYLARSDVEFQRAIVIVIFTRCCVHKLSQAFTSIEKVQVMRRAKNKHAKKSEKHANGQTTRHDHARWIAVFSSVQQKF